MMRIALVRLRTTNFASSEFHGGADGHRCWVGHTMWCCVRRVMFVSVRRRMCVSLLRLRRLVSVPRKPQFNDTLLADVHFGSFRVCDTVVIIHSMIDDADVFL